MAEQKGESTRNLLAQLEGGWDAEERDPKPPATDAEAAPVSAPSLDELDARWGDDLFADDDEEEEEEEEIEEEEPPLPDERLDPVAFAAAKKAREERAAQRKEKRKQKLDAKRARKKARVDANAQKQKKKTKKSRAPAPPPSRDMREARPREAKARASEDDETSEDDVADDEAPRSTTKRVDDAVAQPKSPPWRVIAIGAAVFFAVIAVVAALVNR